MPRYFFHVREGSTLYRDAGGPGTCRCRGRPAGGDQQQPRNAGRKTAAWRLAEPAAPSRSPTRPAMSWMWSTPATFCSGTATFRTYADDVTQSAPTEFAVANRRRPSSASPAAISQRKSSSAAPARSRRRRPRRAAGMGMIAADDGRAVGPRRLARRRYGRADRSRNGRLGRKIARRVQRRTMKRLPVRTPSSRPQHSRGRGRRAWSRIRARQRRRQLMRGLSLRVHWCRNWP